MEWLRLHPIYTTLHYTAMYNDINYIVLVLFRLFGKKIITCNVLYQEFNFDSKFWRFDK